MPKVTIRCEECGKVLDELDPYHQDATPICSDCGGTGYAIIHRSVYVDDTPMNMIFGYHGGKYEPAPKKRKTK